MRASLLFPTWLPLTLWTWGDLVTAEWWWKSWPSSKPSLTTLQWRRKEHFITSEWSVSPGSSHSLNGHHWGGGPPVVLWGWESWLSTFLLWHHSGKSVGVPVKERSLGFRSVFAGGGGDGTTVFSVVFGVKPWLSKHFLSGYNAPLSSVEREQAFVEAFFGLRFLVFLDCQLSSTSSGIFEAKRKPRECTAYRSLGANLPSCFAYFSLPRLQSSHTYFF